VDDEPRISISNVSKTEGKKGQNNSLHVHRHAFGQVRPAGEPVVPHGGGHCHDTDGDYVARTGTLTFASGETTKTIAIEVKGDSKEANETFYLDLFGNSSNSLFTKNRGLGTILNDD
jgi:hypothetical protein